MNWDLKVTTGVLSTYLSKYGSHPSMDGLPEIYLLRTQREHQNLYVPIHKRRSFDVNSLSIILADLTFNPENDSIPISMPIPK